MKLITASSNYSPNFKLANFKKSGYYAKYEYEAYEDDIIYTIEIESLVDNNPQHSYCWTLYTSANTMPVEVGYGDTVEECIETASSFI